MSRTIIIDGSHRNGNTVKINNFILENLDSKMIKLMDLNIDYYDYESKYSEKDNFFSLAEDIVHNYDHIIWTTPMYWYSMSGRMKVFLDRFTDLIKTHKYLGRKLRGKSMSLVYNSNGEKETYFERPFINTSEYLGLQFKGALHINMGESKIDENAKMDLLEFIQAINKAVS